MITLSLTLTQSQGDDSGEKCTIYAAKQQPTFVQKTNDYQDGGTANGTNLRAPIMDQSRVAIRKTCRRLGRIMRNASACDKESARDEYEEQYEETYDD